MRGTYGRRKLTRIGGIVIIFTVAMLFLLSGCNNEVMKEPVIYIKDSEVYIYDKGNVIQTGITADKDYESGYRNFSENIKIAGKHIFYKTQRGELYYKELKNISEQEPVLINSNVNKYYLSENGERIVYNCHMQWHSRGVYYLNIKTGETKRITKEVGKYFTDKNCKKILLLSDNDTSMQIYNIDKNSYKENANGEIKGECRETGKFYYVTDEANSKALYQADIVTEEIKKLTDYKYSFDVVKVTNEGIYYIKDNDNVCLDLDDYLIDDCKEADREMREPLSGEQRNDYDVKLARDEIRLNWHRYVSDSYAFNKKIYFNKDGEETILCNSRVITYKPYSEALLVNKDSGMRKFDFSRIFNSTYDSIASNLYYAQIQYSPLMEKSLVLSGRVIGDLGQHIWAYELSRDGDKIYYLKGVYRDEAYNLYERDIVNNSLSGERLISENVTALMFNCINNDPLYIMDEDNKNNFYMGQKKVAEDICLASSKEIKYTAYENSISFLANESIKDKKADLYYLDNKGEAVLIESGIDILRVIYMMLKLPREMIPVRWKAGFNIFMI